MGRTKLVACRFDEPLYNKINENKIPNSELIRQAVNKFLNDDQKNKAIDEAQNIEIDDDEDLYNTVYNELYNMEIGPLKQENEYLSQSVNVLESDKNFLMEEVRALTVMCASKLPLLQRIKMKLLSM